jgi:hypothetical protein
MPVFLIRVKFPLWLMNEIRKAKFFLHVGRQVKASVTKVRRLMRTRSRNSERV